MLPVHATVQAACPQGSARLCECSLCNFSAVGHRQPAAQRHLPAVQCPTCLQGWSKFYEFSFSDQRAGVDVISLGTKNGRAPQWEYLHGLLENAIYGGRIDNGHDVLVSIKAPQLGLLW